MDVITKNYLRLNLGIWLFKKHLHRGLKFKAEKTPVVGCNCLRKQLTIQVNNGELNDKKLIIGIDKLILSEVRLLQAFSASRSAMITSIVLKTFWRENVLKLR